MEEETENPARVKFVDPNQFVDRHAKPIGIFLALATGIMFATNGALVKVFSVNFVDAVMVRCVIQTLIAGSIMVCLGLCKSTSIFNKKNSEAAKSKYILFAIISLQVNSKLAFDDVLNNLTI